METAKPKAVDIERLRQLREGGFDLEHTAQLLGVPTVVVLDRLISELALSDLDPRPWVHVERDKVAGLVEDGLTTLQIAAELGLTRNQVRHHRIARSGELARAHEKGHRDGLDSLGSADRHGAAAADQRGDARTGRPQKGHPSRTGVTGVIHLRGKFQAKVGRRYIGLFDTVSEAALALESAREQVSA